MKWEDFLDKYRDYPVIHTEYLRVGLDNPVTMEVQISRWVTSGRLIRLKRGVYLIADLWRKREPFVPFLAGVLQGPSYISLHKAMEFYNLIPEGVPVCTSVTTKRPVRYETPAGRFHYRHIHIDLFWGYISVSDGSQTGFMARPEKALLDFFYLNPVRVNTDYLESLRLQNLDTIQTDVLMAMARRFQKPGIERSATILSKFIERQRQEEVTL